MICNLGVVGSNPTRGSRKDAEKLLFFESKLGKYQSGQMGQTVNLLSFDFGGSNPSLPTFLRLERSLVFCGSSSVDRALAFQAEGRGFEPRLPLSKEESKWIPLFLFSISIYPPYPGITNKFWATNKLLPTIISDFIHLSPFLKRSIGEDTENYFFYNEHLFVCQLLNASYPIVYFAFAI